MINAVESVEHSWNPLGEGLQVMSVEESLRRITQEDLSVARFGHGELRLMQGLPIAFQEVDDTLMRALRSVAGAEPTAGLAICVPGVLGALRDFTAEAADFWRRNLMRSRKHWAAFFDTRRRYFNTSITRPYMDWRDKGAARSRFETLRRLWGDRDVLVVEGDGTRLEVGNDLFDSAADIRRVVGPARNAWRHVESLRKAIIEQAGDRLIILALGPTATVLAAELARRGQTAIDLGHLDVEYEWYLMQADRRVAVDGKHVNEAAGGGSWGRGPQAYERQIVARIG